jgi:hypothetical protein
MTVNDWQMASSFRWIAALLLLEGHCCMVNVSVPTKLAFGVYVILPPSDIFIWMAPLLGNVTIRSTIPSDGGGNVNLVFSRMVVATPLVVVLLLLLRNCNVVVLLFALSLFWLTVSLFGGARLSLDGTDNGIMKGETIGGRVVGGFDGGGVAAVVLATVGDGVRTIPMGRGTGRGAGTGAMATGGVAMGRGTAGRGAGTGAMATGGVSVLDGTNFVAAPDVTVQT